MYKPRQSQGVNRFAVVKLTDAQQRALGWLWAVTVRDRKRHPDPAVWKAYGVGRYETDSNVSKATAQALEKKGLARVEVTVSSKQIPIGPFGSNKYGYKRVHWTNALVTLTPAGEALAQALGMA